MVDSEKKPCSSFSLRGNRGCFQGNEERAIFLHKFSVLTPGSRPTTRKCTVKARPGLSWFTAALMGVPMSQCPQPIQPPQRCWAPLLPPLLDALPPRHALFWPCSFPLCSRGSPGVGGAGVGCSRPGQRRCQSPERTRHISGIPALRAAHAACPA